MASLRLSTSALKSIDINFLFLSNLPLFYHKESDFSEEKTSDAGLSTVFNRQIGQIITTKLTEPILLLSFDS